MSEQPEPEPVEPEPVEPWVQAVLDGETEVTVGGDPTNEPIPLPDLSTRVSGNIYQDPPAEA